MAYLLTMADIQAISKLHQQGWSQRRIARELDAPQIEVELIQIERAGLGSLPVGQVQTPIAQRQFLESNSPTAIGWSRRWICARRGVGARREQG